MTQIHLFDFEDLPYRSSFDLMLHLFVIFLQQRSYIEIQALCISTECCLLSSTPLIIFTLDLDHCLNFLFTGEATYSFSRKIPTWCLIVLCLRFIIIFSLISFSKHLIFLSINLQFSSLWHQIIFLLLLNPYQIHSFDYWKLEHIIFSLSGVLNLSPGLKLF